MYVCKIMIVDVGIYLCRYVCIHINTSLRAFVMNMVLFAKETLVNKKKKTQRKFKWE